VLAAGGFDSHSAAFDLVVDYLPLTLQLGLLALVPVIVQFTATFLEGSKSLVEVQKIIYQRYFFFQMVNVFVTIGTVSIFTFISDYSAADIPSLLVDSFPRIGGYFIGT